MSKFFVGQRVRVARPVPPEYRAGRKHPAAVKVGMEAVVKGTTSHPNAGFTRRGIFDISIYVISVDALGMAPSQCLEPILPDGHRACEEDFKRDLDRLLERQGVPA